VKISAASLTRMPAGWVRVLEPLGRSIAMGWREMDNWNFEDLDDASSWFFGSCHRERIARRHFGASAKGQRTQSTILLVIGGPTGAMV
jgi:hypothetical protein